MLLAFGQWWGVFLFVPAGLNGSLAYLVPRWNLFRDAPRNVERVRELQLLSETRRNAGGVEMRIVVS